MSTTSSIFNYDSQTGDMIFRSKIINTFNCNGQLKTNVYKSKYFLPPCFLASIFCFRKLHNHVRKTPSLAIPSPSCPVLTSNVQDLKDISHHTGTATLHVSQFHGHQCCCQHCCWHLQSNHCQCHAPTVLLPPSIPVLPMPHTLHVPQ